MEKQKLVNRTRSCAATLAAGEVNSLRITEDEKTVIRAYDGVNIGIAGRIGEGDDGALEREAIAALSLGIPYPALSGDPAVRHEDVSAKIIDEADFLKTAKSLAARLKARFPDFVFSDKFYLEQIYSCYSDSLGSDMSYSDSAVQIGFNIKHGQSGNIVDLYYSASARRYSEDDVTEDIAKLLDVYNNKLPMPNEQLPAIISTSAISYALSHMKAEMYCNGAGLFAGKLGQKVFDGRVNILTDRTPGRRPLTSFFDSEGVTSPQDKFYFVKDGTFCGLATYRRSAKAFSLPLSGSGYTDFNDAPSAADFRGICIDAADRKLSQELKDRAIYIAVAEGGDMTPEGKVAMPVMLAYLYEGGRLVGTLPEFGISANIFDFLGKDLITVAKNDIFGYTDEDVIVAGFNITK